jgi:hypothetical protein
VLPDPPGHRRRKIAGGVVSVLVVVVLYALVCVYFVGLAWPYPVVLPRTFSLDGATYHRQARCRPLAAWGMHLREVGSLASALWWGGRPVYSYRRGSAPYAWVVVHDDGCYRFYGGDAGG